LGRYSNTKSIPFVIGTPNAQEMRLNVQDDFMDNFGVYAIGWITPFQKQQNHLPGMANGLTFNGC